ncbi:MAG: endonuclease [Bacteroidetes bacterium]|nr:MAG: endonuclease [Bacteroidota bacterium]
MPMTSPGSRSFWKVASVLVILLALALAFWILTRGPGTAPSPLPGEAGEAVRLATWNLYNFGRSKDAGEIAVMAEVLRNFDLVAIQEVSTSEAGVQAVARLDAALDRTGTAWEYVVSDPTTGDGSERYAYLWKPSRVRLVDPAWLEASLADPIDREPYMARFEHRASGRRMLLASFHAVPQGKDPAREIVLLDDLHTRYLDDHLIILGDFNESPDDEAFDELKQAGYAPVLVGQKTSLRMRRRDDGDHLANEYDNIFYEIAPFHIGRAGVLDFTEQFRTLREARAISDHLPVFADVSWR